MGSGDGTDLAGPIVRSRPGRASAPLPGDHPRRPAGDPGATAADVVRTRTFLADVADAGAVGAVHGEVSGDIRPASTMVAVAAFLDPRWRVEIEAEALIGGAEGLQH